MKLTNIHLSGNEHGKLKANTLYADLYDDKGHLVIASTLEYILVAIRERKYNVEGITVSWANARGANCSTVTLDNYNK